MRAAWLGFLAPPLTVYKKGSAAMCTVPITVFWLTAIVSLVYALEGGPLADGEISWVLLGLGVVLWIIAAVWARLVATGVDQDARGGELSTRKTQVDPHSYTSDPLDELRK